MRVARSISGIVLTATMAVGIATAPAAAVPPGKNGRIAFDTNDDGRLYSMNPDGSNQVYLGGTSEDYFLDPSWSPDGRRIAFRRFVGETSTGENNYEIFVMTADGKNIVRVSHNETFDSDPAWSPDGKRIAFGGGGVRIINADGTNETLLIDGSHPTWSPDGTKIAFSRISLPIVLPLPTDQLPTPDPEWDIWVMNADGSQATRLATGPGDDWNPTWSPDGTRIAYWKGSDTNAVDGVHVITASGSNPTKLAQGLDPAWSPDGTKIVFTDSPNEDIFVMNADGSNKVNLTPNFPYSRAKMPDWGPVPRAVPCLGTRLGLDIPGIGGGDKILGAEARLRLCGDSGQPLLSGGVTVNPLLGGPGLDDISIGPGAGDVPR